MVDFIFNGPKRRINSDTVLDGTGGGWVGGASGRYLAVMPCVGARVTSALEGVSPQTCSLPPGAARRPYCSTVCHQIRRYKGTFLLNMRCADSPLTPFVSLAPSF